MKEEEFKAFEASVCHCLFRREYMLDATSYVRQHVGTTSTTQAVLDKETEAKLEEIDNIYQQKKDAVISAIGKRAIVVQPEPHRNLKKVA